MLRYTLNMLVPDVNICSLPGRDSYGCRVANPEVLVLDKSLRQLEQIARIFRLYLWKRFQDTN